MVRGLSVGAAACLLLGAQLAAAQPRTALSWVRLPGAEGCIAAPELARAVAQRLGGQEVFAPPETASRAVEGRVEPHGQGFVAVIAMTAEDGTALGERTVMSPDPDCRKLDASLVLVLAAAVDRDGGAQVDSPAGDHTDAPPDDQAPDIDDSPDLTQALSRVAEQAAAQPIPAAAETRAGDGARSPRARSALPRPIRIAVRLGVGMHVGVLPRTAAAGGLGVSVAVPGALVFGLDAQLAGSQVPSEQGIALRLQPWWVEGWLCPYTAHEGLQPVACLAASVGRIRAVAQAVREGDQTQLTLRSAGSWLVHVGPRLGLRYGLGAVAAWARLGLSLALNRDTFALRRADGQSAELHHVEPVAFGATAGVDLSF